MHRPSQPGRLLVTRWLLALLLVAHGAAHFLAVARIVRSIGLDLPLELFGGAVVTSSWAVAMLLILALAAAGGGFFIGARMLVGREPAVGPLLMAVACLSLLLTVVGLWSTVGGVLVNLAVLTAVPDTSRLLNARRSVFY